MKFLIQVMFIIVLAFILELFLPWWSVAVAAFAGGMLFNTRANFAAGFISIAILWAVKALLIDSSAAAPLTERVASIFMTTKPVLFIITSIVGGLVGGFAAMTGSALHKSRRKGSTSNLRF